MLGEIFDRDAPLHVDSHNRPHWSQAGTVVFVTFRTHDSIPRAVIEQWHKEKVDFLCRRGVSEPANPEAALRQLGDSDRRAFRKHFDRHREMFLDTCHGGCLLRQPELARIVADSLMHFDGQRYQMGDFVVMPNHVHLLATFFTEDQMRKQFDSWLHWTARQINLAVGTEGHFWQEEPFDHLVRSPEQYEYLRDYIRDNPRKACLQEGQYLYRRHNS